MSKRLAAPLEQSSIKRVRKPDDGGHNDSGKHSGTNLVVPSPKQSPQVHATNLSTNVKQASTLRNFSSTRESSGHGISHTAGSSSGALNVTVGQKVPRAAHSGATGQQAVSSSAQRSNSNVSGSASKSNSNSAQTVSSAFSNAMKQQVGSHSASQASSAALASLLPLLYGASSNDKNLEAAAAHLASGALKQAASGQSQSLLSGLAGLPLSNLNLTNLSTLLNYQMAAAMQKLASPAASASSQKKEPQLATTSSSNSHSHSRSSSGVHSQAQSTPTASSHSRTGSANASFAKPSPSSAAALNLTVTSASRNVSASSGNATMHHRAGQSAAHGTGDAPIDLSKKTTSSPAQPALKQRLAAAAAAHVPNSNNRADSAVPNASAHRAERTVHSRMEALRNNDTGSHGRVNADSATRERDRERERPNADQNQVEKSLATANGEAERQIPVITLSDDETADSDDEELNGLFDDEFAQVENLAAPLAEDGESPLDRASLLAARKRLVRELRRTLCDEEARTELLRRWNAHNVTALREGTVPNGKMAQVTANTKATPRGSAVQPQSGKRDSVTARSGVTPSRDNLQSAHGAVLNGGPPNVTVNQSNVGASTPAGSNSSVPLKVPRVSSGNDLVKSASAVGTPPRGAQQTAPPSGGKPPNGSSATPSQKQTTTPQLSAAQLQAQLSASKLALRKQVEKTLGQLAPPKPVTACDIQFVPSVNYNDMLCLVGLDETVNSLQRYESKGVVPSVNGSNAVEGLSNGNGVNGKSDESTVAQNGVLEPEVRTCVQCDTDFTPSWRVAERSLLNAAAQKRLAAFRETKSKNNSMTYYVCERCAVHNQKKTSRTEYLSKLKQTFSQLARDERELEERYTSLIAQAPQSVPNVGVGNSMSRSSSSNALHSSHNSNSTPTLTAASNSRSNAASAMHNALKEAQQLLGSTNSSRSTTSPSTASASASLSAGLGLPGGSTSFGSSSASALSAFTAFTAALSAAASAMKTTNPSSSSPLNLNAAAGLSSALGASGLNASALSGLNASALGVGGLSPASLTAALQAFLGMQSPSFTASRGTTGNTPASPSPSPSRTFPAPFGSASSAFNVASQSNSSNNEAVKSASDLHRQYYLEMVTKPPVLPSWKK